MSDLKFILFIFYPNYQICQLYAPEFKSELHHQNLAFLELCTFRG